MRSMKSVMAIAAVATMLMMMGVMRRRMMSEPEVQRRGFRGARHS
jgi:hypothetical protein